jgi:hypothetical protein
MAIPALVIVCLFTAASFIYGFITTYSNPLQAYFVTPARIWELSLGGIIVFLPKIKHNDLKLLLPWFGLILIAYPILRWGDAAFPGWHALVPTIGTALVIWAGGNTGSKFSFASVSRFKPAQFFGNISYSLYLWHWPLIVLAPYVVGVNLNGRILKIIIFFASILLAWLSYRFVETPFRGVGKKSGSFYKRVVSVWIAGVICMTAVLIPAHTMETHAVSVTKNIVQEAFERSMDPKDIGFGARATQHRGENGVPENPYGQTDKSWAQYAQTSFSGTINSLEIKDYMSTISHGSNIYDYDKFGDLDSDKTILLIGDSYSEQWYPALDVAGRNLGYRIFAANSRGCFGGMFELTDEVGDTWKAGNEVRSKARANNRFRWIRDNLWAEADVVVFACAPGSFPWSLTNGADTFRVAEKLAGTLREIRSVTNAKPIIIQAVPVISDYNDNDEYINKFDKVSRPNDVYNDFMDFTYHKLEGVNALDDFEYLKIESLFLDDKGLSHSQIGGVPVYYDYTHINTLFSASAGEYFTSELDKIINSK